MSTVFFRITSIAAFTTLFAVNLPAQPVKLPRTPSPAAMVAQTIGISTVTVNYSRPSVKGREIWGALVPYGWNKQNFGPGNNAPWRAGANECTRLTLSHAATLEGKPVAAGSYGLFFIINKDNSGEVILSRDDKSWGSFFYDESADALRAPIRLREIPMVETLTYDFIHTNRTSCELTLNWEKKQFPVAIEFAVDNIVMDNAEQELKGVAGFTPQGYISAANYALQNKVETDKAIAWADKAIAFNKNFTALNLKAGLLRNSGKTAEADALMKEATAIAAEAELNQYGYQLIGAGEIDKALDIFKMNVQRNPKSANVWDSLGEGYTLKGDKKNAISSFKKSLSLNPPENVKINSEKFLKQLDAK